jgi:hypothetical protein
MAAPIGNQNAKKGAEWRQALKRALAHHSGKTFREGLDDVAVKVVSAAVSGDDKAWKEIADRMDGRATQSIEQTVEGELGVRQVVRDYGSGGTDGTS